MPPCPPPNRQAGSGWGSPVEARAVSLNSPIKKLPQHVIHRLAVLRPLRLGLRLRRRGRLNLGERTGLSLRLGRNAAAAAARRSAGSGPLTAHTAEPLLDQVAEGLAEAAERIALVTTGPAAGGRLVAG